MLFALVSKLLTPCHCPRGEMRRRFVFLKFFFFEGRHQVVAVMTPYVNQVGLVHCLNKVLFVEYFLVSLW